MAEIDNTYTFIELTVTEYFPVPAHLGLIFNNKTYIQIYL